jgi:hypothetical protein
MGIEREVIHVFRSAQPDDLALTNPLPGDIV